MVSVISDHRSWQCGHLRRRVHRFVEACWLAISSHSERSVLRPHPRSSISASPSDAESTDCCRCPLRSPAPRLHPCHGPTTLRGPGLFTMLYAPFAPRGFASPRDSFRCSTPNRCSALRHVERTLLVGAPTSRPVPTHGRSRASGGASFKETSHSETPTYFERLSPDRS